MTDRAEIEDDIRSAKAAIEQGRYDLSDVQFLLSRMEELSILTGEDDADFDEYKSLLRDLADDDEKVEFEAEQWAHVCEIIVEPIPSNVTVLAMNHYGRAWTTDSGIEAFVRHNLTNYSALLAEARSRGFLDYCYGTLKDRVRREVARRLETLGD